MATVAFHSVQSEEQLATVMEKLETGAVDRVVSMKNTDRPPSPVMAWLWAQDHYLLYLFEIDRRQNYDRVARVASEHGVDVRHFSLLEDDGAVPAPVWRVHLAATILGLVTLGMTLAFGALSIEELVTATSLSDAVVSLGLLVLSRVLFIWGPMVPMLPMAVSGGYKEYYTSTLESYLQDAAADETILVLGTPGSRITQRLHESIEDEYGDEYEIERPDTDPDLEMPARKKVVRFCLWLGACTSVSVALLLL